MKYSWWIGLVACLAIGPRVLARPCHNASRRVVRVQQESPQQAVFAVPVATVVFAVQPAVLYSYRAVARPAPLTTGDVVTPQESASALSAESILRANCFRCHQGEAPRGGASFFKADGAIESLLPRKAILEMSSPHEGKAAAMPPGEARKLNEKELEVLRAWAEPSRDLKY
jgi:mono/diheme cytochrome c family protein